MIDAFVICLFLLYFWYMFQYGLPIGNPSRPTSQPPAVPPTRTFNHHFKQNGNDLSLVVDSVGTWTFPIPSSVAFQNNRLIPRDACHNQPDGTLVSAKGSLLYDYVRQDRLQPLAGFHFEPDSKTLLQQGDSFYFVCNQGFIAGLRQCPPGRVFRDGQCFKIDACTGRDEGVLLPDPFDPIAYYECRGSGIAPIRQTCQYNHWFMHDACRPKDDAVYYCKFFTEPLRINDTTYMKCRHGQPKYYSCPPNTRLFDKFECESDYCVGKPDGALVHAKRITHNEFVYYPGYKECQNGKVVRRVTCPKTWDHSLAGEENLTHLPMVFDGHECSVPKLCKNVQFRHHDTVIPSFQFSRRVPNWKFSASYDSLSGYTCHSSLMNTSSKRVTVDPGERINPKRFKKESACDPGTLTVPVADRWDQFYNCSNGFVYKCPENHIYDGQSGCEEIISNAHTFNQYPFFRFDSLDKTGWIENFQYSNEPLVSCSHPETQLDSVYNVCSHPDCRSFPFLSQLEKFSIKLKEGNSECVFEPATRRIVKRDFPYRYNFWTQRIVSESVDPKEECIPGNKIESGHFVLDATLYMTCVDAQPFVFCPSPQTRGIGQIQDAVACLPPPEASGDVRNATTFEKNEVAELVPANTDQDAQEISINKGSPSSLGSGIPIAEDEKITVKGDGLVKIKCRYRNTHPPNIVWKENRLIKSQAGGFLLRRKDFTLKPVKFPSYTVAESVPSFSQD